MDTEPYEEKRVLFLKAVRYVYERGGDAAVEAAFGDMEDMDALWREPVAVFREGLCERARAALRSHAA